MASQNEETIFSRLDLAFARFLSQRTPLDDAGKRQLAALLASLSQQQRQGHSCIEIADADKQLVLASGLANGCLADQIQPTPLIIEQNRLYLQRYWAYEARLAGQVRQLSVAYRPIEKLDALLGRHFGTCATGEDWQRVAAKTAAERDFCIITGGPGTGKTTTVCKTLAILQELATQPLLIALAAPTGKAAMRLQEAVALNVAKLACADSIKAHIPRTASTLHRLLGAKPPSPYFRHDGGQPLLFDVVVVDEASMVDLPLMAKLVDALKPGGKLVLLGDKDQLASVETGAVLADLIAALPHNTIELKHSHRFGGTIKTLADAVNRQDGQEAWNCFGAGDSSAERIEAHRLVTYITQKRQEYLGLVAEGADFADIYQAFNAFQVLCANRHGKYGALDINAIIEQALFPQHATQSANAWYPGRPVMVMQNNPNLQLYNGDIGICLPDKGLDGQLMVFFQRPDGSTKQYLPARLPACETAFAMTIHKSQGSEFDEALIVLPETINPVLCKELLYTAITRAKRKVSLLAESGVFAASVGKKMARMTGLIEKLMD